MFSTSRAPFLRTAQEWQANWDVAVSCLHAIRDGLAGLSSQPPSAAHLELLRTVQLMAPSPALAEAAAGVEIGQGRNTNLTSMQDELVVLYEAARQAQSLVQAMQQAIAASLLPPDPAISLHQAGLPALSSLVVQQLLELDLPLLPLQGDAEVALMMEAVASGAAQQLEMLQQQQQGGLGRLSCDPCCLLTQTLGLAAICCHAIHPVALCGGVEGPGTLQSYGGGGCAV
ncbi:hypothetical protein V8C86DRAFT_3023250 [Haematococcus lacustris]